MDASRFIADMDFGSPLLGVIRRLADGGRGEVARAADVTAAEGPDGGKTSSVELGQCH